MSDNSEIKISCLDMKCATNNREMKFKRFCPKCYEEIQRIHKVRLVPQSLTITEITEVTQATEVAVVDVNGTSTDSAH